ncbi:MAG: UDP-N-acetylglucosamine 2-epimerase [Oscillospiraceae bacterium]|nr:UDP-N-acetylglucosamine 2-epimerase [Oscillospiraceae bacterium]
MDNSGVYFFIGTEAELIKLFPVMLALDKRSISYKIIASGQNNIKNSGILTALNGKSVDLVLSDEADIKKTAMGLLHWLIKTWRGGKNKILRAFGARSLEGSIMIVHGDTVSTLMGAYIAAGLRMRVAHIEAGLRSHNWLNPFPEEIDRVLTSLKSDYNFAPGAVACDNLAQARGVTVDTKYNTIVDSLEYSKTIPCGSQAINELRDKPYFVFVLHRQENLANRELLTEIASVIRDEARAITCVMILHKPTEIAFDKLGLLKSMRDGQTIVTLPRVEYFDFMKLLQNARFVITDGGSNQEELSYMGKPCLIVRTHTERLDGIGKNAVLYNGALSAIGEFARQYQKNDYPPVACEVSPSQIIAQEIGSILGGRK